MGLTTTQPMKQRKTRATLLAFGRFIFINFLSSERHRSPGRGQLALISDSARPASLCATDCNGGFHVVPASGRSGIVRWWAASLFFCRRDCQRMPRIDPIIEPVIVPPMYPETAKRSLPSIAPTVTPAMPPTSKPIAHPMVGINPFCE